jgi:dienelactone hydrolase
MKQRFLLVFIALLISSGLWAQSTPYQLKPILEKELQSPAVVQFQLQEFLMNQAPKLPAITSPEGWTQEEAQIRKRVLENVIYHGWPSEWVNSPPHFEDLGTIPSGKGYRIHKLRYEIVPGFDSTALLYEPENLQGKAPAVLNVMGHHGDTGKAEPFQQELCINEALRGMIALNLEWIGMGELYNKENTHWNAGALDLVGTAAEGLFFLAERRGLDYLWQLPNVDRSRVAVTGLSGGGWQTIILSSLDDRVTMSIPVAGYTSLEGRLALAPRTEAGDIEQNATDLVDGQDYSTLTAIRAPKPTLEINNAEDDCCFRAPMVKPYIYEPVRPFYRLFGKESALQFYQSTSISAHNYGLEDREAAYRFYAEFFGTSGTKEIDVSQDVKSYSDLAVGVPPDNLTISGIAKVLAAKVTHPDIPSEASAKSAWAETERSKLKEVIRYHPVIVQQTWMIANTNHNAVESASYRFLLSNGLGATGVWLRDTSTPAGAPLTVILNDAGAKGAASEVWDHYGEVAGRMDRGEQVLVVEPVFTGNSAPEGPEFLFPEMLAAAGNRSLGLEAAQIIALSEWARATFHAPSVRIESTGIRSQVKALVASALAPRLFSEAAVQGGMHSLRYLVDKPVSYEKYADLFCLDLYKDFDLDRIIAIAEPTKIAEHGFVEEESK